MALKKLLPKRQQDDKTPPPCRRLQKKRCARKYPSPPSPPPSLVSRRDSFRTCRTIIPRAPPGPNRFSRGSSLLSVSSHISTDISAISNTAASTRSVRSAIATVRSTFSEQVSSLYNAENPEERCVAIPYCSKDFNIEDLRPLDPVSRLPPRIRKILDGRKDMKRLDSWRKKQDGEARLRGWDRDDVQATEADLSTLRRENYLREEIGKAV